MARFIGESVALALEMVQRSSYSTKHPHRLLS